MSVILNQIESSFIDAITELNVSAITDLFTKLNTLKPTESNKEFYKKMGDLVFRQMNFIPSNYSLEKFEQKKAKKVKSKVHDEGEDSELPFSETFIDFYNRNKLYFSELKDYYFFRLENGAVGNKIEVLILCCPISHNSPIILKLANSEKLLACTKKGITDYLEQIKSSGQPEGSFICVMSITPTLADFSEFEDTINKLFDHFEIKERLKVKNVNRDINKGDYEIEKSDKAVKYIKHCSSKTFNNSDLCYAEETLIKSFFKPAETIINYKILVKGQSGSRVIEAQAKSNMYGPPKRFVIKIAKLVEGEKNKLEEEVEKFKNHVEDASTTETAYKADYKFNEGFEAIRYNYASTGSIIDAIPFSKILRDYLNPTISNTYNLPEVIDKLLLSELFANYWLPGACETKPCSKWYESYLKKPEKIDAAIKIINDNSVNTEFLDSFFKKTLEYELKSNLKVCHGDLHTDNFFWDGKSVTLIDFGFTDPHHSVVDHTFLEASIKMKHFPIYVASDEILKIETRFLETASFEEGFDLSFIRRTELRNLYDLIHKIRVNSKKYVHDPESSHEYMISLFIITYRQIQFWDLNQLLCLRCSELYARHLSKRIFS